MSCNSDRIVRITYPKSCCPEVNDSQQLLYNGPALECVDVQTNQTLNDAIKEIDALICNTLNNFVCCHTTTSTTSSSSSTSTSTSTTTTTQTPLPENICFRASAESFEVSGNQSVFPEATLINGKVWYKISVGLSDPPDTQFLYVYWDNTSTYQPGGAWVVAYVLDGGLTPPFAAEDIFAYLPFNDEDYPDDCVSGCIDNEWTYTENAFGDFYFATLGRGECPEPLP